jgi:hypothetical protein
MDMTVMLLMEQMRSCAERSGVVGFNIDYRRNAKGEHVVVCAWPTRSESLGEPRRSKRDPSR